MSINSEKILLPNDVRKLLNIDNKEIVELCKKTSVNPKKDSKGQIYFSVDEGTLLLEIFDVKHYRSFTR